ncbi:hypothetical protein CFC21_035163 [Triticum aestivum]|uniref:Uncharacterized protein n=4 Tax=Triticum TaxID=4564 RepID=M7ZVK0_TRIUA|nr:hypothetical protein TRIUR3_14591 [Triticum urartu]KAF7022397.1 hypothetical protein CFC21_035163 [Triticum aestivum]VAH60353.1 unnamed protein product [Triticum turgidum subsp. durum]
MLETRNSNKVEEKKGRGALTGAETDDPHVEEVEVGDAGLALVDLVQPASWAPFLAEFSLPRCCQQWRRRRLVSLAGGH